MHLHTLLGWDGPMTARQYEAWQAWREMQWNRPDRHDFYLMRVAAAFAGDKVDVNKFRVRFDTDGRKETVPDDHPLSLRNQRAAIAKSEWRERLKRSKPTTK